MDFLIAAPLNPGNGGGGDTSPIAYVVFGIFVLACIAYMITQRRKK